MSDEGFFAEIAATPDDPGPYLVYADALMERGDPRGDLISIQHALETASWTAAADLRRREAALVEANRDAWLGPVLDVLEPSAIRWRLGFVHAARVRTEHELAAVMALPHAASTLVELRIGGPEDDNGAWPSYQDVIFALPFHPALRRLYVTDVDPRGIDRAAPVELDARVQGLETLVVQARALRLELDATPSRLRELVLLVRQFDERVLARCSWPRLASFVTTPAIAGRTPLPAVTERRFERELADTAGLELDALAEVVRAREAALLAVDGHADYYRLGEQSDKLTLGHQAEVWLWKAVEVARWKHHVDREVIALGLLATTRWRRGDPATAAQLIEPVVAHYRARRNRSSLAWALRQRGNIEFLRSNFELAEANQREALAMYRELHDKTSEAIVLSELAGALWSRHDFEGAAAMSRESIAMREPGSFGQAGAYYNLGAILNAMNRHAEAEQAARSSLAIYREHRRPDGEAQALSLLGELMQRTNRHAEAEEMLDRALALHRARGALRECGITLGSLAAIALDRGEFARATELAEEAVELHVEVGNKYNEGLQRLQLANAAIGERRLDEAESLVAQAMIPMRAISSLGLIASAKVRRGFIAQLRGELDAAERHYEDAVADAIRGSYPVMAAWTRLYRAVIRARQGRLADARVLLEEARALFEDKVQGLAALATAEAVVTGAPMPEPTSYDAHIIMMF